MQLCLKHLKYIFNYMASSKNFLIKVITDVSYACFKKLVKHHLQSNSTTLIRLNVRQKP